MTSNPAGPYNRAAMPVEDPAMATAIRRQEERLAKDPTSLAFAQLADLYRKAGRQADAIATCRAGLLRYPHYTTARLILAKALLVENDPTGALTEIEAILQVSPKDVQCHRLAAEAQLEEEQLVYEYLDGQTRDREARVNGGFLAGIADCQFCANTC